MMMSEASITVLRSPAKLNLGLTVAGKLPTGKHHLVSLMTPIPLYDIISIEKKPRKKNTTLPITIHYIAGKKLKNIPLVEQLNNIEKCIIRKTFTWLKKKLQHADLQLLHNYFLTKKLDSLVLDITIEKNIPSPAGLGGGSSNAASFLTYLLNWVLTDFDRTRSAKIEKIIIAQAHEIGADVPFFLSRKTALLNGVYQIVQTIDSFFFEGFIAIPPFTLSTPQMFQDLNIGHLCDYSVTAKATQYVKDYLMFTKSIQTNTDPTINSVMENHNNMQKHYLLKNDFLESLYINNNKQAKTLTYGLSYLSSKFSSNDTIFMGLSGSGSSIYCGKLLSQKTVSEVESSLQLECSCGSDTRSHNGAVCMCGWKVMHFKQK